MPVQISALWALFVVAVVLGTVYAIMVPSKIDEHFGPSLTWVKGVSALISGIFFSLFAAKHMGLDIPSIELSALAVLLSGAGPSVFSLMVSMAPEWTARYFGKYVDKGERLP